MLRGFPDGHAPVAVFENTNFGLGSYSGLPLAKYQVR